MKGRKDEDDKLHPRNAEMLLGQAAAEDTFFAAWNSGRMPHAWLIGGPRGIGKATFAFHIARFVLAPPGERTGPGLLVGPEAPTFRRVASGGHTDLLTVEREYDKVKERYRGEITVEHTRAIAEFLHLTPAEGDWRVVIVDGADEMNRNAANAILKILEEPPPRALILLVSHVPGRLLVTIRSRCRFLPLLPVAAPLIDARLAELAPKTTAEDRREIVALAQGSLGVALDLAEAKGAEVYRGILGLIGSDGRPDPDRVYELADGLGRAGEDAAFRTVLGLLQTWLRRAVLAKSGRPPAAISRAEAEALERVAARGGDLDPWLRLWDNLRRLAAAADGLNLDRKQVFLDIMLRFGAFDPGGEPPRHALPDMS